MSVAVCRRSLLPVPAVEDYCQCCLQVLAGLRSVALTKKLRQLIPVALVLIFIVISLWFFDCKGIAVWSERHWTNRYNNGINRKYCGYLKHFYRYLRYKKE